MIFARISYMLDPMWIEFGTGDVHRNLLNDCDSHEYRLSEGHVLLTGVRGFLLVLSTSID
jgi:hypothetical protein